LLAIEGLVVRYGAIEALRGVSLAVGRGEMVSLVGANGAGKSTLLRTIAGLMTPVRGSISLEGRSIAGAAPEAILASGIAMVPERRRVFTELSVRDNLLLGAYIRRRAAGFRAHLARDLEQVYARFPILEQRGRQAAGTLSGGEQQMLAIGRALMSRPRLLLCDEPSLGLAPLVVQEIMRLLGALRESGTTVLLVEQNARAALRASDRAYVLETGEVRLEGPARALLENEALKATYLGG
jgi:branched-chain amino acid transport system ATP-binding protein